jgi:hypothetical protein
MGHPAPVLHTASSMTDNRASVLAPPPARPVLMSVTMTKKDPALIARVAQKMGYAQGHMTPQGWEHESGVFNPLIHLTDFFSMLKVSGLSIETPITFPAWVRVGDMEGRVENPEGVIRLAMQAFLTQDVTVPEVPNLALA